MNSRLAWWQKQALLGAGGLVVALTLFESLRATGWQDSDLWSARIGIASVVLLLLNLAALWRYTQLTGEAVQAATQQALVGTAQAQAAAKQAKVSADQLEVSRAELHATQEHFESLMRPCVVIEREVANVGLREQPQGGGWGWYARNVGAGPALNTVYAILRRGGALDSVQSLGSIGPGERALLRPPAQDLVADSTGVTHVLLADGTQRGVWVMSLNERREDDTMTHRVEILRALNEHQRAAMLEPLTPDQQYMREVILGRQ